jgi:hypothetical protein
VEEREIRAIDHLVLPVTTLTLARSRLTSLGFRVAPDARHPFGTGNCCVFLSDQTYLEPITIVDRTRADIAAAEGVTFVKRLKRFTERQGEGFAMVALASTDAESDRVAFEKAKIGGGAVYRFGRTATLPDGSEQEIGVATAFTEFPDAGNATFFACQHLNKGVLFQPDYLEHPNGALGITAVVAVAEDPGEFAGFLAGATGKRKPKLGKSGIEARGKRQSFAILTPAGFRARYDLDPPNPRRGMLFAAFDLDVLELERAAGYAGSRAMRQEDRIVVPATPGVGAVIAFRSARNG